MSAGAGYVWRLRGGVFVHPGCREDYQNSKAKRGGIYPAIDGAVYRGYSMSRFTLCCHCQQPIWDGIAETSPDRSHLPI